MASIKTKLMGALQRRFPQNEFRYSDIIKTLKEDVKGEDYEPTRDRGYYACNISNGYLSFASKFEKRHLRKNPNGSWSVIGDVRNYPTVHFIRLGKILVGKLLTHDSQGNARIQLLKGGAPVFVKMGEYSENEEEILKLTKERIEREHGHSYREYIRLMREIGEK